MNHGVVTLAWAAVLAMLFGARRSSGVLAIATLLPAAAAYCRSAKHDESYGYPCTAAVEWRKAAELLAPVPALADRCWCEWERLMQISRRLAGPVEGREFLTTDFWLRRPALEAGRKA